MTEVNNKIICKSLKRYGIKPKVLELITSKPNRQVWRVTASQGEYALKYIDGKNAVRTTAVSHYLQSKGVPVITILSTLDGDLFVRQKDGYFILFQWIDGVSPHYDQPNMIERITALLAKFHEASRGYVASGGSVNETALNWSANYVEKMGYLEKVSRTASCKDDPFMRVFLSDFSWLHSRGKWVLEHLPHTAFNTLVMKARLDPLLGHDDYSRDNLLVGKKGDLTIIDLDTVGISLPMCDLSKLITWINHDLRDWSGERLQLVLNSYQRVRPITEEEQELLLVDQVFPHQAISLIKHYQNSPSTTLLEEFERCLSTDRDKLDDLCLGPL